MQKVKKKKIRVTLNAKSKKENKIDWLIVDLETSQNTYKSENQCKSEEKKVRVTLNASMQKVKKTKLIG